MTDSPAPASRRFQHQRLLCLTPPLHEHAVRLLAAAAHARWHPISAVIGIAQGGLPPAHGISHILQVPTHRLVAKHNPTDAIYTQATGHVTTDLRALAAALNGEQLAGTVLLVDDICGSGATLTAVRAALRPHLRTGAALRTATLCRNADATLDPDLWIWTVDDWVHFPWETPPPPGTGREDLPTPGQVRSP